MNSAREFVQNANALPGFFRSKSRLAAGGSDGTDFAKKGKEDMSPLHPIRHVPVDPPTRSGPIPDEEDNASELVEIGRRTADTETRDAVTERYVDEANAADDTDEALADIARIEAEEEDRIEDIGPETEALHSDVPPED